MGREVQPAARLRRPEKTLFMRLRLAGFKSLNCPDRRKLKKAAFLHALNAICTKFRHIFSRRNSVFCCPSTSKFTGALLWSNQMGWQRVALQLTMTDDQRLKLLSSAGGFNAQNGSMLTAWDDGFGAVCVDLAAHHNNPIQLVHGG